MAFYPQIYLSLEIYFKFLTIYQIEMPRNRGISIKYHFDKLNDHRIFNDLTCRICNHEGNTIYF
jgi:hypothetical protein